MSRTTIKKKDRKVMAEDPARKVCMLYGWHGHVCGGRVTWEHTLTFAGKSYQEPWAIISLCARGHAVDQFQDNHECNKEINLWIALNRATTEELQAISKAEDYPAKKERLNRLYGVWSQKIVYPPELGPDEAMPRPKKPWFLPNDDDMSKVRSIQAYIKSQDDYEMPYPDVIRVAIQKMYDAVEELKSNVQM